MVRSTAITICGPYDTSCHWGPGTASKEPSVRIANRTSNWAPLDIVSRRFFPMTTIIICGLHVDYIVSLLSNRHVFCMHSMEVDWTAGGIMFSQTWADNATCTQVKCPSFNPPPPKTILFSTTPHLQSEPYVSSVAPPFPCPCHTCSTCPVSISLTDIFRLSACPYIIGLSK